MTADLADLYGETRRRLTELIRSLSAEELARPAAACPGWSAQDVVAHLTGVAEDAVEGRLTGPPDEATTAEEVCRFRDRPVGEVVDRWESVAPAFEELIGAFTIWPALIDVVTHEHDIRAAVGRPGARDSPGVRAASTALLQFDPPVALEVRVEDDTIRRGPEGAAGRGLVLETTRWDALRWRMGRRSRRQLAAMHWSGDPSPVLDHLVVFGPAVDDIVE